jgi:hypothetical protein
MLAGGVVVGDQMRCEPFRNIAAGMVEKREELLMAMARLALGYDRPVERVERREQGGGSMPIVVVGCPFDLAQARRQRRLGKFQRRIWLFSSTHKTSARSGD